MNAEHPSRAYRAARTVLLIGAPLLVLAAIWVPEVRHHHLATPAPAAGVDESLRSQPADAVLARLDELRYGADALGAAERVARAGEILQGQYRALSGAILPLDLEPDDAGLEQGSPAAQLEIASLAPADTLLAAYRLTGEERYYAAALRSVLAWGRYERAAWLPRGFLWNDHAVAARIPVLASLWRQYRHHPGYRPEVAAELLGFVSRTTARLASADHYTARTNHGVMQDLALLHAAAAFPALDGTARQTKLALGRLQAHLAYYVAPGGAVLEHSSYYQDFAIELLGTAVSYLDILEIPVPATLEQRHAAAECRQRRLTRPDGSIPAYGDSWSARRTAAALAAAAAVRCPVTSGPLLDTDFGYAAVDDFGAAGQQLFVTWANFPGRAHKHDDDLALWLWADGADWWSASGYWPYGDPLRDEATSWRGSNAPHGVGEGPGRGSSSVLRGQVLDGSVRLVDLERSAADGRVFRRQVAAIRDTGVFIIDTATGRQGRFESVWTMSPSMALHDAGPGRFRVTRAGDGAAALAAGFTGDSGFSVRRFRGSSQPFAGLVAVDGSILPADAVEISAPAGGWTLAAWNATRTGVAAPLDARMLRWSGPEQWLLGVETPEGRIELARNGGGLTVGRPGLPPQHIVVHPAPASRPLLASAEAQFAGAARRYPPFRDLVAYRWQASLAVGVLALLQFPAIRLAARAGLQRRFSWPLVTLGWAMLGGWLYYSYLV